MCWSWFRKIFIGGTAVISATDKPSPADIVNFGAISVSGSKVTQDLRKENLNIPFTKDPIVDYYSVPKTKSMDSIMDFGNHLIYIKTADEENHKIMVDWIAKTWLDSKGLQTVDCAYRFPADLTQPARVYNLHRLVGISSDNDGRYFTFRGFNSAANDPYRVRDENIIWLVAIQNQEK